MPSCESSALRAAPLALLDGTPAIQPLADDRHPRIAVVIPCFRAAVTIDDVIGRIGPSVTRVYVVDDGCPERSGERVSEAARDPRLTVIHNGSNLGVGGAVKRGYAQALRDGADVVVKLDADGQMDPAFIPLLVAPILAGQADYTKGNRFAPRHRMPPQRSCDSGRPMPPVRRLGNNILSFLHKGITGYWNVVDPTNGYTAIGRRALAAIDLTTVADCYFFETDMLFHLNVIHACVQDVPLPARYAGEVSSLRIRRFMRTFLRFALHRSFRRVVLKYFVHDFNVASVGIALAVPLIVSGAAFGFYRWFAAASGELVAAGTVSFALPIILGTTLLLSAIGYDMLRTPKVPISRAGARG